MTDRGRKSKRRFTFKASIATEPMPAEEWNAVERLLARLIVRAYAADNPQLFPGRSQGRADGQTSGPSPAARADAGAPPALGGGPERMELEPHDRVVDTPP